MNLKDKNIVILATDCDSTNMVYHALNPLVNIARVIVEDKEDRKIFLKRRVKKLGWVTVAGQIAFQGIVAKYLTATSKKRYAEIIKENGLNILPIPEQVITRVKSVNGKTAINLLKKINPDLIIVNGTRIISGKVLSTVPCRFINTHVGITPMYRGVHGGYWAVANKDPERNGVTVHFVDEGIDTGSIIAQAVVTPTKEDNFATYPTLQMAKGVGLIVDAVKKYFSGEIVPFGETGESNIWYHPTIWQYLKARIIKGVK